MIRLQHLSWMTDHATVLTELHSVRHFRGCGVTTTAGSSTGPAPPVKLFSRASSGLIRELSLTDTVWYGVFSGGALFAFVYLFPTPQFVSPGINIPLMLVLTLVYGVVIYYVYAALGSAMPRAGGDYLYESRSLHPVVGFTVPWACQLLFWLTFPPAGAYVLGTFGLVPIAQASNAPGVVSWLDSKNGIFIVSAVIVVICWLLTIFGLHIYRRLQRFVLVPGLVISTLTIIGLLIANFGTNFRKDFDAFQQPALTTQQVAAAAAKAGYHPVGLNLGHTLIWIAVLAAYIPYSMYSAQGLLGEVKGARSLNRLFFTFLGSGAILGLILLALPFVLISHVVGSNFLNQYAWAYGAGLIHPTYLPNIGVFLSMLTSNPIVVSLVSLGFIVGGFAIANVVFINSARVMMAMGLDRSLPTFFSDVSDRYHTPVKAATLWSVCALGVSAVFAYVPNWLTIVLISGAIASVIVVGVTCLAAIVFPFRAPEIYRASPCSRYQVGPIPLVSIMGLVGTIATGALTWVALFNTALGLTSAGAHAVIGGAFGSGLLVYAIVRIYRRREGVDTSLTFRYVPPE
jgi:APA family basic amino acid/polyamine antiporter